VRLRDPTGLYTNLVMRRDMAPGSNLDFVLAMKHLFDREQMLKSIQLGRGVVANDQPIARATASTSSRPAAARVRPEKAKFHLQKSGLGSAASRWWLRSRYQLVDIAQVLQYAASRSG
jgi:peptide/nickel transport system substrate-binding protein